MDTLAKYTYFIPLTLVKYSVTYLKLLPKSNNNLYCAHGRRHTGTCNSAPYAFFSLHNFIELCTVFRESLPRIILVKYIQLRKYNIRVNLQSILIERVFLFRIENIIESNLIQYSSTKQLYMKNQFQLNLLYLGIAYSIFRYNNFVSFYKFI